MRIATQPLLAINCDKIAFDQHLIAGLRAKQGDGNITYLGI